MFLHVHVVGTTGLHARERREYKYAPRCSQCGVAVDATQHVGVFPIQPVLRNAVAQDNVSSLQLEAPRGRGG